MWVVQLKDDTEENGLSQTLQFLIFSTLNLEKEHRFQGYTQFPEQRTRDGDCTENKSKKFIWQEPWACG